MALLLFPFLLSGTEIVFWHAFEGFLYDRFAEIVEDFNHQSKVYQIKLVYQGNYAEAFQKGMEAFEEGSPPHLLQVYEVATQTMMLCPERFVSVDDLMRRYYKKFDRDIYIDAVRDFYSTAEGKMFSLPWNASTGILFYNKKAFERAGLDPDRPPKTWNEIEAMGAAFRHAARVSVTTRDGRTFSHEILNRRGSPENPLSHEDVVYKFRNVVEYCLSRNDIDRAIALIDRLETLDDTTELRALLAAPRS